MICCSGQVLVVATCGCDVQIPTDRYRHVDNCRELSRTVENCRELLSFVGICPIFTSNTDQTDKYCQILAATDKYQRTPTCGGLSEFVWDLRYMPPLVLLISEYSTGFFSCGIPLRLLPMGEGGYSSGSFSNFIRGYPQEYQELRWTLFLYILICGYLISGFGNNGDTSNLRVQKQGLPTKYRLINQDFI